VWSIGRARRRHPASGSEAGGEQASAALLAGLLEFSGKFAAANRPARLRWGTALVAGPVEGLPGGSGARTRVRLQNVPARDALARGDVFPDHAGQRSHFGRIHLDKISALEGPIILKFFHRVGARK
jgi:hypothetical protein